MRWFWVACLATSACNLVLGIDEAAPESSDLDNDGVDDSIDNCPGLTNPLQLPTDCKPDLICDEGTRTSLDRDRDGIDDGCDPCLLGPPDDEDGDGVADACDLCPAFNDDGLTDVKDDDMDGIGRICDLALTVPQTRLLFDGFNGTELSVPWKPNTAWRVHDGLATTTSGGQLEIPQFTVAGDADGTWSIEVGVELPATAASKDEIGLHLGFPDTVDDCKLVFDGTAWRLQLVSGDAPFVGLSPYNGKAVLRVRLDRTTFIDPTLVCEARGGEAGRDHTLLSALGPIIVNPYATANGGFRYVEIIGRR
jgi:hypothetical protein